MEKKQFGHGLRHLEKEFTAPCYECGLITQRAILLHQKHLPMCSNCQPLVGKKPTYGVNLKHSKAVKAGIARAMSVGVPVGAPKKVPDEEIYAAYKAGGKSMRTLAEEFGVGLGTVHKAVKDMRKLEPVDK